MTHRKSGHMHRDVGLDQKRKHGHASDELHPADKGHPGKPEPHSHIKRPVIRDVETGKKKRFVT